MRGRRRAAGAQAQPGRCPGCLVWGCPSSQCLDTWVLLVLFGATSPRVWVQQAEAREGRGCQGVSGIAATSQLQVSLWRPSKVPSPLTGEGYREVSEAGAHSMRGDTLAPSLCPVCLPFLPA